jgi:hypothetical protein
VRAPEPAGDYSRACPSALGQMVGQSLECLRKTHYTKCLRREVYRSTAPLHDRRSSEPQVVTGVPCWVQPFPACPANLLLFFAFARSLLL